jgi:signal transduction histidine kinase
VLALITAAVFLVVETVLVVLLKQVDPADPAGLLYAGLMAMALLANFVVGVVAARKAVRALNASRARIVAAGDQSRRQIERDLHNGAQQRLVSLALELRIAQTEVPPGAAELRRRLDRAFDQASGALDELRDLSRGIHPAILTEGGLPPALRGLGRRSPIPVQLDVRVPERLPDQVEVSAYYIVAEALTNAAKHSRASTITVTVERKPADGSLFIEVADDGVGGAHFTGGTGLVSLNDRAEALGGHIDLYSPRGAGTTVSVALPLNRADGGGCPGLQSR